MSVSFFSTYQFRFLTFFSQNDAGNSAAEGGQQICSNRSVIIEVNIMSAGTPVAVMRVSSREGNLAVRADGYSVAHLNWCLLA